jgi:Tol biopolymer transport system component
MALSSGVRLGPYEILGALGAGGMGEVYRARDTRLDRTVAIKILPANLSSDPVRKQRFEREAKTISSLNHPHICVLHDVGQQDGIDYLVMECVEGETLAKRLEKGALPLEQVLKFGTQIADALDKAHRSGIIHRDLKPGNIMLTPTGAKLLDFGLAKTTAPLSSAATLTAATRNSPVTEQGSIVGTFQYMSPEQIEGKELDGRSDIFSFGAVLYEMLTGQRAFQGKSQLSVASAILEKEPPPISSIKPITPPALDHAIGRCLAKDAEERWQTARDVMLELKWIAEGKSQAGATALEVPHGKFGERLAWSVAALLTLGLGALMFLYSPRRLSAPGAQVRFQISPPEKVNVVPGSPFALSPDGRQLVFYASGSDRVQRLWVHAMDSLGARPLPGSESANYAPLFWSPDSRFIAFYDAGALKKIDISGGQAETVCDLTGVAVGGSWNRDGEIIFGSNGAGLMRVSANGGRASPLTTLDASRKDLYHALPSFLPDGRHFIYERFSSLPANNGIFVGSLDAKPGEQDLKRLLTIDLWLAYETSSDPGAGRLIFTREGSLMTQSFDARKLELVGEPTTLDEDRNVNAFSVSGDGVLVYSTGGYRSTQLNWIDRHGKILGTVGEPSDNRSLALSPDGTKAAVSRFGEHSPGMWLIDFSRGTNARFTLDSSTSAYACWSPDARRIIFASNRDGGTMNLYQKLADGAQGEELLLKSGEDKNPTSWSRDGRFLLYSARDPRTKADLWVLPLDGDKKPTPFLQTEFNEQDGRFSPDGHWVAYTSDESGRNEIYVRVFAPRSRGAAPDTGGETLISTGGGVGPRWREDGKELFYVAPDGKVMAVEITSNPVLRAGVPKELFQGPAQSLTPTGLQWDVAPDGKRFLMVALAAQSAPAPFTVVLNWQAGLKK